MKLYHGSLEMVDKPEIRESDRTLDYGKGFYATTSIEQAENWVKRRAKELKACQGYVNIYEFDESLIKKMKCLIFYQPTEEWVDFVHKNRTIKDFCHDYDIVYGPIADDGVTFQLRRYEGGVISLPRLVEELNYAKGITFQYFFGTERALQLLKRL
jgi:hypothetical protein